MNKLIYFLGGGVLLVIIGYLVTTKMMPNPPPPALQNPTPTNVQVLNSQKVKDVVGEKVNYYQNIFGYYAQPAKNRQLSRGCNIP